MNISAKANKHISILGVPHLQGKKAQPRLEVNDFIAARDGRFFSLYVQAFERIKGRDINNDNENKFYDDLSYFQINGIHGLPFIPWNDATTKKSGDYCRHQSELFLPWHRVYALLFEQAIQAEAVLIANTYVTIDAADWLQAAEDLRLPYWDFGRRGGHVPPQEFFLSPTITITLWNGKIDKNHPNPFISYDFPKNKDPYLKGSTERGPNFETELKRNQESIRKSLDKLLLSQGSWKEAGTKAINDDDLSSFNSLEAIHDTMHDAIGGHMAVPETASFEPLFHLFHAQFDHLMALWFAIHPDAKISPDLAKKPLDPFWEEYPNKWTAEALLSLSMAKNLNYTYPEFEAVEDLDVRDPAVNAYFKDWVHHLYADGPRPTPPNTGDTHELNAIDTRVARVIPAFEEKIWVVRVRSNPYQAGGTFSVRLFLGKDANLPPNPDEWSSGPGYVGSISVFARREPEKCTNCVSLRDQTSEAFVHINDALQAAIKRGELKSMAEEDVTAYLKENLYWRVIKRDNQKNYRALVLSSLEVLVGQATVSREEGDRTLHWGKPTYYNECTRDYSYVI